MPDTAADAVVALLEGLPPQERRPALASIYFDADGIPQTRSPRVRSIPESPQP